MDERLEESKVNWNVAYGVSEETFTQAAAEILSLPIERIEVRRCILMGSGFGRLTVFVYSSDDEDKYYYRLNNGATCHTNLSPNIHEFKVQLADKIKMALA
jgi:uncharacterized protein (UPF0128 family)